MHVFSRLGNVVVAPATCFTSIRDEGKRWTDYVVPFVLLISMMIVFLLLSSEVMQKEQISTIQGMEQLSPGQKEQAMEKLGSSLLTSMKYTGAVVQVIVSALFTALIFWIAGNFVGGGEHTFGTLLVTALYIQVITIPESILKLLLILQKESVNVYLGLASFVSSPEPGSFGFQFLAQFEFFKIWRIVLWYVAFRILYRYGTKKSALLVGVPMLLGMLLAALFISMSAGGM